jgi:hypothetical protein
MRLIVAFAIAAACASCGSAPEKLTVQIGMTASEVNGQPPMSRHRKLKIASSDWMGHNGPLELLLRLNGRTIQVPVSGANGGVQLATWRGLKGNYPEARLNSIVAVVEPQRLAGETAFALAESLCAQARNAGLNIEAGPPNRNAHRNEMEGIAACAIRDETQSFEARVVPLGVPPSGKYRVEVSVHAYFEP